MRSLLYVRVPGRARAHVGTDPAVRDVDVHLECSDQIVMRRLVRCLRSVQSPDGHRNTHQF